MNPAQFIGAMKKGTLAPVYLFLGAEAYDRRRCKRALLDAHLTDEERVEGLTHYDLSQSSVAEVIDDARALSLFATKRLIIAGSAEAALPKSSRAPSSDGEEEEAGGGSGTSSDVTPLVDYLRNPTPGVVVLFEATRFGLEGDDKKKAERVAKYFSAIRDVVEFEPYSPDDARHEAQAIAKRLRVVLEPSATEMLVEALGADISRIATELEKLSLLNTGDTSGRPVTPDDIQALVPDARASTIFALVNALGRRDRARALAVLDTLCREGEYLPLALSFLSSQFRQALIAREVNLRSSQQIQGHFTKLGVPMWGSRAEQVNQTATKFSREQLERGLKLIFETDRDLRSARPDDRIVMEQFVVKLTA